MSYNIVSIPLFDKQAKRLAKKYPSLKNDLAELFKSLIENPTQGKLWAIIFTKFALLLLLKAKENRVEQE